MRKDQQIDPHPASVWRLDLLGGFRLASSTQQLARLPSRAITTLLARLALAPERAHAREELIELLWPGVELEVGRNRLRQALSSLKSLLEPAGGGPQQILQADRNSIRLVSGTVECDAVLFERHVRAGRVDAARALYRGELLPGINGEWIDEERVRFAALNDRLDHLPAPAARATQASTLTSPPPPASATRLALPTYLTQLFGADEQAARLRDVVLAHRLVTLLGPGGAGKTRLAVETAHSLRERARFDLIAFVPLVACTTRAQASDTLLSSLQVASTADDPLRIVVDALAGRRVLLVLDNLEQLIGQAEGLVADLIALLPALHLIVTSRRALGLDGEREFALAALELPPIGADLETAARNPAVGLFVERARAVRPDFHIGARNSATLVELVRALEGMPLAIELAACRVRTFAPAEMLARLQGGGTPRLELLARGGPRAGLDPRHASMQRTIEWSCAMLAAPQMRLLTALTVFPSGFTATAAHALVADAKLDAQLLLDDLVANSLVYSRVDDSDAMRFGLYAPIREYAASQLDAVSATHWRQRLRVWALEWARSLPATPPLVALRLEMSNLLAALAGAVSDNEPEIAIELLAPLHRCLEDVELPAEGMTQAVAAVELCTQPSRKALGHALLAPLLYIAGQSDAAHRHAEIAVQGPFTDERQHARALYALARVRWRSRRVPAEVEPLLAEALALAEPTGDLELCANLTAQRAFVAGSQHRDPAASEGLHLQALALWERSGNQVAINSGRYNLAVSAQNRQQHQLALERLEPVISSARELQDWRRLSQALNVKGNAHSGLRQWPDAVAVYQECIRTAWDSMATFDLAFGLWNLPRALAHLQDPERAIRLAAYAATFWRGRFGQLNRDDSRYLVRVRRLAAQQIDQARIDVLWREGEALLLADAVDLALAPLPPATP